jgi:hypothetical protein
VARIRTIKPEFFTSLSVASLKLTARLTFIGLWTHCDDEGRCVDEARLVKAALWPLDDRTAADVESDLRALAASALIIRYEVGGRRYLAVSGWAEHQRINRPTPSRIPPPPKGTHGVLSESSRSPHADPWGSAREPSLQPEMSDFSSEGEVDDPHAPTSDNGPNSEALTSGNGLTEDSVSPHGALTESSRPERKGKEQGTGISLSGPERAIADATDATEDETREILSLINRENTPRNLAAYVKTLAKNGDLPALLHRVRTGDTTPRTNGKFVPGTGALAPLPTDDEYATGKVIL